MPAICPPRTHLQALPPYTPIEPFEVLSARLGRAPEDIVKLDANENPYGLLPEVRAALADLPYAHIYPDPESRALRTALEAFTGVPQAYLLAGAGADELIDLLMRVILDPGDAVLVCPPTFGMYAFDAGLQAARVVSVPRRPDFSLDLAAIRTAVQRERPKALFLATPNNPDGSLPAPETLDALLDLPVLVVLDEAYIEFSEPHSLGAAHSRIRQVPQRDNLVVLRTFSKWAGLAGLRVGYGAFPEHLLPALWKAKQPYNVNVAASTAAIAALKHTDALRAVVSRLVAERERLYRALQEIPALSPYPSQANYVLCRLAEGSAADLKARLAQEHGILVRQFAKPGLEDCIRISAGRPEDTDALVAGITCQVSGARCQVSGVKCQVSGAGDDVVSPIVHGLSSVVRRPVSAIHRATAETEIRIELGLDGDGRHEIHTGLGFLDHMLTHVAVHGLFDVQVQATGDLHVDPHHTLEDVALALGAAFEQALGERKGIARMGSAFAPMDETLAHVAVDFSGRPYCVFQAQWHAPAIGEIHNTLWAHFFQSFAVSARCTLHARVLYGGDDHHQAEALFKALGRALDAATRLDPRRAGQVPSTKGSL